MAWPCRRRLLAGPVAVERGARAKAGLLAGFVTPWEALTLEQFVKNCSLWEGLMLEKFMEDCLLWEGPHTRAVEECEESSP